jgi:hypothetical protein
MFQKDQESSLTESVFGQRNGTKTTKNNVKPINTHHDDNYFMIFQLLSNSTVLEINITKVILSNQLI